MDGLLDSNKKKLRGLLYKVSVPVSSMNTSVKIKIKLWFGEKLLTHKKHLHLLLFLYLWFIIFFNNTFSLRS